MRKLFIAFLPAVALLLFSSAAANADTLDFTITGTGPLSAGTTITFSLPSSPVIAPTDGFHDPASVTDVDGFVIDNPTISLNGTPIVEGLGFVNSKFGNGGIDFGGFLTISGDTIQGYGAAVGGDQIFTGSGLAPTFIAGTYALPLAIDNGFGLPVDTYSLTITSESTPPIVPEPSSLLLLSAGVAGLAGIGSRRFFRYS